MELLRTILDRLHLMLMGMLIRVLPFFFYVFIGIVTLPLKLWWFFYSRKYLNSLPAEPSSPETVEALPPRPRSQEYAEECERLRKLDADGDRTAAFQLYALIRNREPHNPEWLACLKRAALEFGNYEAQYELASSYRSRLCREDGMTEEDAMDLYRRSAAQGYRKAKSRLKSMGLAADENTDA